MRYDQGMEPSFVTIGSRGRITIPRELRAGFGLGPGAKLRVTLEDDAIVVSRSVMDLVGSVKPLAKPLSDHEIDEIIANEMAADMHGNF